MFLNSVVLVLQEILEASLLISVLLVLSAIAVEINLCRRRLEFGWLLIAGICGIAGAWVYAALLPTISEWFDYVGQELFNATLHGLGFLCIVALVFMLPGKSRGLSKLPSEAALLLAITLLVLLALVREGAEIIMYLSGVTAQAESQASVLLGAGIGAGIGVSSGVFLFYTLVQACYPS